MMGVRHKRGRTVGISVALIGLVFIINTGFQAYSQSQTRQKNEIKEEDTFQRPEPTRPIKPEIPGVNRYQEDKVFLEYADSLYKLKSRDTIQRQILKGNVKFRQSGLWMFCDSAYYYPEQNSLDAFSNVRMEQGDTLFVYADQLFYNGDEHLAKLKNGPTQPKVILINKDVTLTTDSLDYDISIDLGWYQKWGTLDDKVNTLTSLYGEYSPKTKRAEFFVDVEVVNQKDGFTMLTDTLYYSTETHIANIESRTEIRSENDTIFTNLATYYTDTGNADLLSRSLIIHRDSTGNVTTLEGDSIIYDNATRISRAYMYQDPFKRSTPMVITDTAQKTTLIGGFGIYNDSTKEALATIYPLLMEYSQGDTLFLRADTIKTFIVTEMVPDKRRKTASGFPEFNGVPIIGGDSTYLWIDTTFFKVKIPYLDSPIEMLRKVAPPYVKPENIETVIHSNVLDTLSMNLQIQEKDVLKDMSEALEVNSNEVDNQIPEEIDGQMVLESISDEEDSPAQSKEEEKENSSEVEALENEDKGKDEIEDVSAEFQENTEEEKESVDENLIPYESHIALAYHRGRFFKKDMQGVADSIVFVEKDSMLYMFRKPIIWSEERQVTGNRIDVHFNDSTTDWAYLPEFGLMSEHVEEDFYNQIYGKEITAYFEGQGLRRMSVSGNVETIFLPQEEDSTFNRLVNAESSFMEVYLDSNKLDWLKMWPEVSGTVTPIFLVKRAQMYLQKFKWWSFLRPQREWYGDQVRWADNLGEVPDELEQYFLAPSDFGEPKSFTGTRVILPETTISTSSLQPLTGDTIGKMNNIHEVPDSLINYENSPGVKDAEDSDTLGDIIESDNEEGLEAESIEAQTENIETSLEQNEGLIRKEDDGSEDEIGTVEEANNE